MQHPPPPPPPRHRRAPTDDRGTSLRVPQAQGLTSGGPIQVGGRMAEHMVQVAYNAQHRILWHWEIPAYLVTKHIAGGAFLLLALIALTPLAPFSPALMAWIGGFGLAMLLVTLGLLVVDLDRPDRFFYLLLRPQWRSWVARAAWILSGFAAVGSLWWAVETAAWLGWVAPAVATDLRVPLAIATLPLSALAATYTALLFAQAEGRDLWQAPHIPVQMGFHALLLGAAPFLVLPLVASVPPAVLTLARFTMFLGLTGSATTTLVGDLLVAQPSEVARRAHYSLVRGKWRQNYWWGGLVCGHVLPLALLASGRPLPALAALICAVLGLYLYEVAFVTVAQEVPNS